MTFHIWPRVGGSSLVQQNEVPGALLLRAQGLLSSGGISSADLSNEMSVYRSESACRGSGSGFPARESWSWS